MCYRELQKALDGITLPEEHNFRYPLGHSTRVTKFKDILQSKQLTPARCNILEKDVLYCTYGAIHYLAKGEANAELERPIGMMFNSKIVNLIDEYYPLDTGMVKGEKDYGAPNWKKSLLQIMPETKIVGNGSHINLCKLIYTLYGSHTSYMNSEINSTFKFKEKALQELQLNLKETENILGVDTRGRTIECHLQREITLLDYLECIILPLELESDFNRFLFPFRNRYDNLPEIIPYNSTKIFQPDECAYEVKRLSLEYVEERYLSRQRSLVVQKTPRKAFSKGFSLKQWLWKF